MHETNAVLRVAWSRGPWVGGARRQMRVPSGHPRLGEVVLVSVTLLLAGLLLATVRRGLEASHGQVIQIAPAPVFARFQ